MGVLSLFQPRDESRAISWASLAGMTATSFGGSSTVSVDEALRISAAWACMDVIASAVSETPIGAVRSVGGRRRPVEPRPALLESPSAVSTSDAWLYQVAHSMASDGNAFGLIVDSGQVELLDPALVWERRVEGGVLMVDTKRGTHKRFPHGDLLHIPGRVVRAGDPFGLSPIAYGAAELGRARDAGAYGTKMYKGGGHPSSILSSSEALNEEDTRRIKDAFRRLVDNASPGEPMVMGSGLKWESIQATPEQMQFLAAIDSAVLDAARRWGVPASRIGAAVTGSSVTYANVTDDHLLFQKTLLNSYMVRIESALSELLPRPQKARFNRDAYLRMDPKGRHEIYAARLAAGTMTVNEVRRLEDEDPFDGDEYDSPPKPVAQAAPANDLGDANA